MIIKKISRTESKKLLLFFAGWGMDANPFSMYRPRGYDLMVVYDYSTLDFDENQLSGYNEIKVITWSMGVWAAAQFLQKNNYPITTSIAINGTHFPVNDEKGISTHIYHATLENLSDTSLLKFQRRMCGTADVLSRFLHKKPKRDIEDLRKELKAIGQLSACLPPSSFSWDKVYISSHDLIFPVQHQQKAWQNNGFTIIDAPHYPEKLFEELLE